MTQQLVDARALPPAIRHPSIVQTFDSLAVGESFILLNDHYPLPLLYQLQAERGNGFDWSVLEASAGRFRVRIDKRDASAPRSVDEYLSWDHRRLDALWEDTRTHAASGALEQAQQRFAEFMCGLERHIDAEEKVLFPMFTARAGANGPVEVMCHEHVGIRKAMREIADALAAKDVAGFEAGAEELESILGEHNHKEEKVLYPMTDRMLGDYARAELVRKMQTIPALG